MAYRSSGANNVELINNLRSYGIVNDERVYQAMLRVDRGDFAPTEVHREAYFDQPLLSGKIHMSAPHIYGTVLGALDLQAGHSFLNIGSGSGYLSTIAGCLLEGRGVNHGVDVDTDILEHARHRHQTFLAVTPATFFLGNVFELDTGRSMRYDRVYVGAECPSVVKEKLMSLLIPPSSSRPGGLLVGPMGDELVCIKRTSEADYTTAFLCAVRFAPLRSRPGLAFHLPSPIWSPAEHYTYPISFRSSAKALLMVSNREEGAGIPRAVWMEVLTFADRLWFDPPSLEEMTRSSKKKKMKVDEEEKAPTTPMNKEVEGEEGGRNGNHKRKAGAAAGSGSNGSSSQYHHPSVLRRQLEGIRAALWPTSTASFSAAATEAGEGDVRAASHLAIQAALHSNTGNGVEATSATTRSSHHYPMTSFGTHDGILPAEDDAVPWNPPLHYQEKHQDGNMAYAVATTTTATTTSTGTAARVKEMFATLLMGIPPTAFDNENYDAEEEEAEEYQEKGEDQKMGVDGNGNGNGGHHHHHQHRVAATGNVY